MSEAIEVRHEVRPSTQRALLTKDILQTDIEQRQLLGEYVAKLMVKETDYGTIPGTPKPTLLKPGAEKLVDLFRCTPEFTLLKSEEDFDRGFGFFNYVFRVRLLNRESGAVLAEGFGSANSREARYRWRKANRKCPACGKEAIIQGKAEWGGGWVCLKKKDGCGAKFKSDDKSIEEQASGQVENEDIATMANTILKMAKKRALVDGAIALARCSDMFTQDVEDFADAPPLEDYPSPPPNLEQAKREAELAVAKERVSRTVGLAETVVEFGDHKGKPVSKLDNKDLASVIHFGLAKLSDSPNAKWAKAMRENIEQLRAEEQRRLAEYQRTHPLTGAFDQEPGSAG